MSSKQKLVIIVTVSVMIIMVLYPPFQMHGMGGAVLNEGYAFIFNPPSRISNVNTSMLFVQLLVVMAVGSAAWFIVKSEK